ncbi:MAG: DUF1538 domain-containing protein [Spirochaetales bacterium]|jgi:hypothetical protein|nr:DUF1538 domain-containing protein [Spirochaetales bacterium]
MNKILKQKIIEAFSAVLPITLIVLLAAVILVPMPSGAILMFLTGAALLVAGMGLFTMGADMALTPMGEGIGAQLAKKSSLALALIIGFIMGVIITIAEPDLQVLADQVSSIPFMTLIITVGLGVGFFLAVAVLRIILQIPLSALLIIFYIGIFIVAYFIPSRSFIPMAFDSGGVTTGPMTVPFMLSMGVGLAALRGDKHSQEDSFGIVALCSVGPILTVLLLGLFFKPAGGGGEASPDIIAENTQQVALHFIRGIPRYFKDVCLALAGIVIFFLVFQLVSRRFKKHQLLRIGVGFVYTLLGLVIFLTGVNVGFIPLGHLFGAELAASPFKWILVPLGMIIGYYIVKAEPAVHVLNKQVEDVSRGAISRKAMNTGLSIGMAAALGITMIRILTGISIMWFLIPGYAIALILTFFVPKIFTGIAFDSGGVCSGPMTSTFLLPLSMGVCQGAGKNMAIDAFGTVAAVAMTPLIVIQILGLIYNLKIKAAAGAAVSGIWAKADDELTGITEYEFTQH